MAEEVKKIITVEVGKSITSIRDFKKHIDDLRGSLLGLNEESDEYKTIAEQIATDQAKLNDVMKIGKTNTDAAAGSYVDLNNQLKALRNQYKSLSESERNSATGQGILQNITRLDTQLKDIDESMGQYQRNVGNYKQAFESVFSSVASEVGKINPTLGNILSAVQKLIPAFKGVGTAAKATGTSIKTAMASTGIGLLVVALSEIVAHWKEISEWVNKVLGKQKDLTQETKNTKKAVEEYSSVLQNSLNQLQSLLNAKGFSSDYIYNHQIKILENNVSNLNNNLYKTEDIYKRLETIRKNFRKATWAWDDETKKWDEIYNLEALITEFNTIAQLQGDTDKIIDSSIHDYREFRKAAKNADEVISQYAETLKTRIEDNKTQLNGIKDSYGILSQTELTEMKKRADAIGKTQEEIRRKQYQDEIENAKTRLNARMISQKEYDEYIKNAEATLQADLKKIREDAWKSSSSYAQLQEDLNNIKSIQERLKNQGKSELEILKENHDKEVELINRYHNLGLLNEEQYKDLSTKLNAEYWKNREEIIKKNVEEENRILQEAYEAQEQLRRDNFNRSLQSLYDREERELHNPDLLWTKNTSPIIGPNTGWNFWDYMFGKGQENENKINEQVDKIFEIRDRALQDQISAYDQYLGTLKQGSDEYLDIERQKTQAVMDLDDLRYEHAVELNNREVRMQEEKRQAVLTIMSNTVSVYSSLTDALLAGEEQGSNKWKAFKTSEAVVNMLSGVLAAFMSGFNSPLPAPWNIALAASTAAVAAAAGAAQIAQIQSTKMGSTSSASNAITGGSGASSVGVSPLLNPDYDLQRLTNLSLQSDAYLPGNTQVYVLESDIQEVGNRVQVRENNATF